MDICLHDVALERQLIDARNDDNISRRLRQAADLAAVQRIQSDESAAVIMLYTKYPFVIYYSSSFLMHYLALPASRPTFSL